MNCYYVKSQDNGYYEQVYGEIHNFKDYEGGGTIILENEKKTEVYFNESEFMNKYLDVKYIKYNKLRIKGKLRSGNNPYLIDPIIVDQNN